VPYDLFQITAPINRQNRDERSPCHTLARDNAAHAAVVQTLPVHDPCPTLTSRMQGSSGWAPYNEDAHLVASVTQPLAFDTYNHTVSDVCQTIKSPNGGTNESIGTVVQPLAFDARQTDVCVYGDKTGPLDTDPGTIGVQYGMSVRRLTPTECERLQGFPDGWTAIPWKGKPISECPDGPRYRALGNSMAVNVMRWIGRRIELVEKT
jgi:DNA (cytosine-5)-methyltransferase 1